jgi:hypothetical protein
MKQPDLDRLDSLINKLEDRLEADPPSPFTAAEVEEFREGLLFIRRIKAIWWFGGKILLAIAVLATVLAQIDGIKARLLGAGP